MPIVVPHLVGNAVDRTNALRFRGPSAEVEFFIVRGARTVKVNALNRHVAREARCVNRPHLHSHKVPRNRARLTVLLRGAARPRITADSSIERAGFRRCVGGQAPKPAGPHPGPSIDAATKGELLWQGAESASERLGARQSNNRFERSMMVSMTTGGNHNDYRFSVALRGWRSAQPDR